MSKKLKVPPQGEISLNDVIKYMENTGILNKKYDADLDGIVDNANAVQGKVPGTAAGDLLVLDTAGQVPLANLPLIPATQLGFSLAWEKVAEISPSAAVSAISFTGLSGDTDKIYMIVGSIHNSYTLDASIRIRFNLDTTIGHYAWIYFGFTSGGTTYNEGSQSYGATTGTAAIPVGWCGGNARCWFVAFINAEGIYNGTNTTCPILCISYGESSINVRTISGGWLKQAEITEIQVLHSVGAYLSPNSKIYLFKAKW